MRYTARPPARRLLPALAAAGIAALALPLMAPTCQPTTPGVKTFAKGSIVIPMDECYQGDAAATQVGCAARDTGNVIQAYGVVYQLIKNNIPVYWVIAQNKATLTDVDVTIQISSGPPVGVYNWTNGTVGGMPANNATSVINYRGGPFVVDASDYAAVQNLFQNGNAATGTPALKTLYSAVKVHVSQLAFQGYAAKTFSGGWSAGGTVAPPIALLDICGGDNVYAESVIQTYLTNAGLDFAGAGGNPTPTGHGQIYDRLLASDFIPSTPGDWTTSNLGRYGYRILWAPHWEGLNSYNSTTPGCTGTRLPNQTDIDPIIKTIGGFVAAGHDLMSECASIGTLEGVFATNGTTVNTTYFGTGSAESRFQTTGTGAWPLGGGFYINEAITACTADVGGKKCFNGELYDPTFFSSPFMQLGDFVFAPVTGAIDKYRPAAAAGSGYRAGVSTLISNFAGANQVDYFSLLPSPPSAGVVVYLAGHTYNAQTAGTRLVLNTLFNLGATCVTTNAPCSTGKLGVCAAGTMQCVGGVPTCVQTTQPSAEVCDGLDNDCNGAVDDIAPQQFYSYAPGAGDPPGPGCTLVGSSYQCNGLCHPGVRSCVFPASGTPPGTVVPLTVVSPQLTPVPEVCDGLDNDCDGTVDNGIAPRPCYDGASGCTWNAGTSHWDCLGTCAPGTQTCSGGSFGLCTGEVLPGPELCEPLTDTNCNGIVGDGCGCVPGATRICYTGPAGTQNVGLCRSGTQTCDANGLWPTACSGQVLPAPRGCTAADADCNGVPDSQEICGCAGGVPQTTASRSCYDGPAGTAGVGVCLAGTQACLNGVWASACPGEVVPATVELCNGKNDTCSATWSSDDGVGACGLGLTCVNGTCVPSVCGLESFCPTGYSCDTATSKCIPMACAGATPPNTPCPQGQRCQSGACVDPCAAVTCGPGAFCSGGACVGGGCLATGCTAPQVCLGGTCQADPCASVTCPTGTFCRPTSGTAYCVQSCYFVACPSGQRCGQDGLCVPDPCSGVVCGPGQVCSSGACAADPCASVACGIGQVCQGGSCVPSPCNGVTCPVGQCVGGQCFSAFNPTGAGGVPWPSPPPQPAAGKSGCGCGGGSAEGLPVLLLGLLALPLARRRRAPRPRGGGAALLAALLALGVLGAACGGKSEPGTCTATTCGSTCTDPKFDPANCGACGAACSAGQICVDSKCGPGSAVAPAITTLTPAAGSTGGVATVGVAGQRFQSGATVVALGTSAPVTTTFVDSGHLTAQVDLTSASPAQAEIRVVNPDKVISNGLPYTVTAAAPLVSTINPTQAVTRAGQPPGTTLSIAVSGTGFVASSQCRLSGPSPFPEQGLLTTYGSATSLSCALDLSITQPGAYSLAVANGAIRSNAVAFTVTSGTPVLTGISPTGGQAGTVTSVTASGSGFDSTSQVLFDGAPFGTTWFIGPGTLYAEPLSLAGKSVGSHSVTVRNGAAGAPTAAQTFTVTAAAPVLNGVTVSPSPARQGQAGTLTLTGTGFDATSRVNVLPPGGTVTALTPATQTATQLTASYTFAAAGSYSVSVVNGSLSSGALTVTAISNVAVLAGISPASGQQGQTGVSLTLTATNLGAAPTVHLASPSLGCPSAPCSLDLTPTVSGNTLTVGGLSLAGWDAGTFAVTVVNAGAAPSNGLGFTVTPGQPTLASALTVAVPQKACAVQGPTPVPIVLTGTNFAKPDASGNGGSSVHASAPALGVTDFLVPQAATAVASTTQINVSFDTTLAVPGTYAIAVWNPGPTVLKSAEAVTFQVLASGTCP